MERNIRQQYSQTPPTTNVRGAGKEPFLMNSNSHPFMKKIWRKGKWTEEEEVYAEKIVSAFNAGILDIPTGTTLRTALSELLNCDPMRITKKFSGSCIGKQPYIRRSERTADVKELKEELEKSKSDFHAMVERNFELQNSNFLFTTFSPYSQILQEYLPIMAESGGNYHTMLHQHAMASLQVPPSYYPNIRPDLLSTSSSSSHHHHHHPQQHPQHQQQQHHHRHHRSYNHHPHYLESADIPNQNNHNQNHNHSYPHSSHHHSHSNPYSSSSSSSTPSQQPQDNNTNSQSLHPQQSQSQAQSQAPASSHDWDNEWGIPPDYDPIAPRLTMLYYSSTPNSPHTTNQPYIYLPPRCSYPGSLQSDYPPSHSSNQNDKTFTQFHDHQPQSYSIPSLTSQQQIPKRFTPKPDNQSSLSNSTSTPHQNPHPHLLSGLSVEIDPSQTSTANKSLSTSEHENCCPHTDVDSNINSTSENGATITTTTIPTLSNSNDQLFVEKKRKIES